MLYTVLVREVHVSHMQIEAPTPEEDKLLVSQGEGKEVFVEYSHTMDRDTWTVEERKPT